MTSMAIQLSTSKKAKRLLPPLTVCPLPAYKSKGIFHNNQTPHQFGCKFPCERNSYPVELSTYHFNSILWEGSPALTKENYYHLFLFYRSASVEKQVEVLIYDLGGFIAAAGGNLGLCLGFSCLSILFAVTDWTKIVFGWMKQNLK
jgi:hypothetical protein